MNRGPKSPPTTQAMHYRRFLLPRMLRPLRHRSFALLWGGQSLSSMGNAASEIAVAWLVYDLTGSPLEMGTIMALFNLPLLALVLIGGVAADRVPRRTIMLASDAMRCLLIAGVAYLIAGGQIRVWHLQVAAVALGAADAFFFPAYTSVIPDLVPAEELVAANSLHSGSRWLARVLGPVIGAWLVATGGVAAAFSFDAATFGASAFCLAGIRSISIRPAENRFSVKQELAEGFRAVTASTWLWFSIAIFSLIGALDQGAMIVVLPRLVLDRLGVVEALGLLRGALGAGSVVGTLYMGQRGMPHIRGIWLYGATAITGLTVMGLGLASELPVGMALATINGAMWAVVLAIWGTSLQDLVPVHLRGRVRSIDCLGSYSLMPVGMIVAGLVADALGAGPVFLAGGMGIALLAASALLVPDIRRFGVDRRSA